MKKNFITNLAFLLVLNLLIKPIYAFGIDISVQNTVGATNYGSYFILLNFSLIFQIILDLGIENFSRRELARNPDLIGVYFSNIISLKLMLGLVYFGFCLAIGLILGWKGHQFGLLALLLLNRFLSSFITYFRSNLGGLHMFRLDSLISVLDRLVVILICGFLLIHPVTREHFRVEWLVYSQTFAYLVIALIAFAVVFHEASRFKARFDRRYHVFFLRKTLPYAFLILLMAAYLRGDSVLLSLLRDDGTELAGIYAQSFRIIEILSNYGYLFTFILLPMFSRMIQQEESVEQLVQLSARLLFIPAVIITAGCTAYRFEIIELLYVEHTATSGTVFGILIFSFLGICVTYVFGTLLTANGNLRQLNVMAFLALVMNVTLNLFLIRKHGTAGAAAANVTTQFFTSCCQIFLAVRIFRFRINTGLVLRIGIFAIATFGGAYLFRQIHLNWLLSLGMFFIFAFILSLFTRLFDLRSLWTFVQSEG